LDGVETAARIRERFDIPIVYLWSHPERMITEEIQRTRPAGFISKPVRDQEVLATVETALYKHRMETKLRESEMLLAHSQQIAHVGSWILDVATDHLTWSDETYRIFGLEPQAFAVTYEAFLDAVHPEDRAAVDAAYNKSLREGEDGYDIEHRIVHRQSGEIRHVHEKCIHERNESGEIFCSIGTVQDITERKQVEEKLAEERKRLNFIMETTRTHFDILDTDLNLHHVDSAWQKIYGDPEGRKCYEYFMGLDTPCPGCGVPLALETKEIVVSEEFLPKENRSIEVHTIPFQNAEGEWLVAEFNIDITERKRAEQALKHRMAQLTALGQAAQAVTASLDLDKVLTQVISLAHEVAASDYISVALVDKGGQMTQAVENVPDVPALVYRVRDEGISNWITHSRRPVIIDQIGEDGSIIPALGEGAPRVANAYIVEAGVKSAAGLPLMVKDHVLGVIFFHSLQPGAYHDQLPVLMPFANQVAIAIENARLYQAEHESRKQAEALRQATQAVSASLGQRETLGLILKQLKRVLVYDTASVLILHEGDAPDLVVDIGYEDEQMTSGEARQVLSDSPILSQMARDLQSVVSGDVRQLDAWTWVSGAKHVRSWLGVPLVVRDQMIGALMVDQCQTNAFGESEKQIAETFAQHVAQAIENARLMTKTREQARQVRQIMDTVPEGVLLLDAGGRVLQANPVAEGDLLVLAGAAVGDTLTHLGSRPLAELLTSPPVKGLWHEIKVHDGRTFEVIARPVENGPEPEQWVLVIKDATREREIQAQIQQQAQLAAVGQLAAGIAHDFNNIMTVIVLYTQMGLNMPDIPPKLRERLEIVSQQARRAIDLIQQILDFGRRAVLERRPMDLSPFLKEVVKLLERTVPENIQVKLSYGQDEYIVNADPTRMQQAIMNLATNARDAMLPQGGGELRITLSRTTATDEIRCVTCGQLLDGEWVRIAVTDSGSGIPPEALPHMFEPFFTTKEVGQGTGLGLSQVYGIVKQHEGHINFTTQVGQGTTFNIYLPALQTQPPATLTIEKRASIQGQGEMVLVVEDNTALRKALTATLELLNYRVLQAANGHEALAVLEQHADEIALVLSDLVMPEMGGQALFHAMQQRSLGLPVVMLSGHPMENELETLQAQGLAGWMLKPPSEEQLSQLLARVLNGESE